MNKLVAKLTEFNFEQDFCHVALVDAGANESKVMVMKAKQVPQSPVTKAAEPKEQEMADPKEVEEVEVEEVEVIEVQKDCDDCGSKHCKPCNKKKESKKMEKSVEAAKELELEIKKSAGIQAQLEVFKKAALESDKKVFVAKALEMKNIVKDDEASALFIFKSLAPDAYEVIAKALETANTALENMEVVTKSVGDSDKGNKNLDQSPEEIIKSKSIELMKSDSKMTPAAARTKARDLIRKEALEA